MACLTDMCPSDRDTDGLPVCHWEGNTGQVARDGDTEDSAAKKRHDLYSDTPYPAAGLGGVA